MTPDAADRGSAILEFVWATLLLLVPFVYAMLAVFDVQRAAYGTTAASEAATRAYVQAPDASSAQSRARTAAELVLSDHGLDGAHVTISCTPECWVPGSTVQVRIDVDQPLPLTPSIFSESVAAVHLDATHSEPFGRYREAS